MNSTIISRLLLRLIRSYQVFISPTLPMRCRYYPTCSEYGKMAIVSHGAYRGSWLTFKRISRCHPLGGQGIDFVPLPLYKDLFYPIFLRKTSISVTSPYETLLLDRGVYIDNSSYRSRLSNKLRVGYS